MPTLPAAYDQLSAHLRDAAHIESVVALLSWDQETYMPPAAAPMRAEQLALLARLIHERKTDPRLGDLISACEADAPLMKSSTPAAACIRELRRDYDRATRLPADLVAEIAETASLAQHAWKDARAASSFKQFAPWCDKIFTLARRKAECLGAPAGGELYDALIDEYEPDAKAAEIKRVFDPLREQLSTLVLEVKETRRKVDTGCLSLPISAEAQHAFGLEILKVMGFDLEAGRLDTAVHPFCSGNAAGDTRLTTRYRDEKFTDSLFGTMHEAGHGLYEQFLPKNDPSARKRGVFGLPLSQATSLGIHESQSRMWENFVGRSREFWSWALPKAAESLHPKLKKVPLDAFFSAINTVSPSLIRVEADEATYNLHIMIRFEIERGLLSGDFKVKDLPGVWNESYQKFLNIKVPNDAKGCLQDVHWSIGAIGYFPTYTLGNLYAAQFWEKILTDMPSLPKNMAKGRLLDLRDWLADKIHRHGRRYTATELCRKVTGKPLSAEPLLRHLRRKAAAVYGIPE